MNDDWRNNPKLAGMDRSKLDMLQNLASQGSSKGANEMLPFLMSAAAQGKKVVSNLMLMRFLRSLKC